MGTDRSMFCLTQTDFISTHANSTLVVPEDEGLNKNKNLASNRHAPPRYR